MRVSLIMGSAVSPIIFAVAGLSGQTCPDATLFTEGLEGPIAHVRYLADDALAGRDPGTDGERCAGEYIAARFAEAGLQPAGDAGSWFQTFEVRTGSRLAAGNVAAIGAESTDVLDGWVPFGFSASASAQAPLIWVGAGVTLPEGDDAGATEVPADLSGRIAVVEATTPGHSEASLYSDPHFKASVLARRGAAGVIVLLAESAALPDPQMERRPAVAVPTIAVAGELAARVREAAHQGTSASLVTAVEPAYSQARNVVALLPGTDAARAGEVVIVGAHYDHLGMGGDGSLEPGVTAIHNGADDNASGTAGLIETARRLAMGPAPERPVLFVAFSGEEKGLLGSAWFTDHPTVAIDRAVAMLNMDMIGRLRDNTLTIFGMATAPEWEGLLTDLNTSLAMVPASAATGTDAGLLNLALMPDGYGPSDHSEFYAEGIPVLHFFTNTHGEYHRPADDWQTLDGEGLERVTRFVTATARRLAGPQQGAVLASLTPVAAQPPAPGAEGESRGYGPYFGSIPDMAASVEYGVRLSGVREDSPAARAGLQAGDVLVRFGDVEVTDLYAFTYALRDARPGDRVDVVIEREGVRYTFNAVLGERR
jgi:aminopeptidase YwaD